MPAAALSNAFDRGNALLARGDAAGAAAVFAALAAAAPDHAAAHFNLAGAQLAQGRLLEAAESLVRCLKLAPSFGPAHVNLADALRRLGLLDHAQTSAETALALLPGMPAALLCLANCRHDAGAYAAAVALYEQALALAPDDAAALTSLGNTLLVLGQAPAALAAHDQAVALAPTDADIRFNRAAALLACGDFARGWAEYEWRWQRPGSGARAAGPQWQGEALAGRTILLTAEQGLGDTLQMLRYVPLVARRGGRVVLEVQPGLERLAECLPGAAQVITQGTGRPSYDVQCPLFSLPLAFGTTAQTIPAAPYLRAAPAPLPSAGLRVGLVWAGSSHRDDAGAHLIDRRRSLALAALAPLADIDGICFVSLQKGPAEAELCAPPPGLDPAEPIAGARDFADTAAVVAALDLVIAVDTSVAHLAGGIGRPVWLLSRYDGCWRWLRGRDDSPWYPTMRLYRQERPGDWAGVIARVRNDLRRAARR